VVERELEKRNREAFKVIISELERGASEGVSFGADDVSEFVRMVLRITDSISKGTARRNLRLMAHVIIGLKRNQAFEFDRFQKWANPRELFVRSKNRTLQLYPNADIRLAISRAIAVESTRGWRFAKEKQRDKIDVVIALAMAALASVRSPGESTYDGGPHGYSGFQGPAPAHDGVLTTTRHEFGGMPYIFF
jgi:hypothetical protein